MIRAVVSTLIVVAFSTIVAVSAAITVAVIGYPAETDN